MSEFENQEEIAATVKEKKETDLGIVELGGFWMRFWAYLLDLIVISSIGRLIVYPIFRALDLSLMKDDMFAPISILSAIIFYGYFVLMTRYFGQTLGKMAFGLKVIELDGKTLQWSTILFRELIGRFISASFFVLYIVVAFTNKKQGIHDLFADTTVIREKRAALFKPVNA
ncbi:RDD family protein [Rossellomorea vietnamensis]|uniref:RDD family protein n=1 Tax=Rossellomorea vietnamensis TaxID=218284 RepID=A0A5D4NZM1_9BACI|nr:RDD family protein [Rossellomorea vietnamensis]TYS19755.1 RDD family protein [Rossellomorea vietnamensis]